MTYPVEHLGLCGEVCTFLDEVIKLDAALQHGVDSLVQDDLRVVKVFLNAHDRVCFVRVLVLFNSGIQRGE